MNNKKPLVWAAFAALTITTSIGLYTCKHDTKSIVEVTTTNPTNAIATANLIAEPIPDTPKIQVVFALDCTGSMSDLIKAAKDKIWSIATGMSQTSPAPDISFGFVFYRDRGDVFVSKIVKMNKDLDLVYKDLMKMVADGGGDTPESVNKALNDAVSKFEWDADSSVYKVIFLVGDAPPHMDYHNDVPYPLSCKLATQKNIIINTILCGSDNEAGAIWKKIANKTQGKFLQLKENEQEIVIKTPYDKEIARLMQIIDNTRIYYGSSQEKDEMNAKMGSTDHINNASTHNALSKRAEYLHYNSKAKAAYWGTKELVSDIQTGKIKLENIPTEQLPENMQKMTMQQRIDYVNSMIEKRNKAQTALNAIIKEKEVFVDKETAKISEDSINNSFSGKVHSIIVEQAKTKNIKIDKKVKN